MIVPGRTALSKPFFAQTAHLSVGFGWRATPHVSTPDDNFARSGLPHWAGRAADVSRHGLTSPRAAWCGRRGRFSRAANRGPATTWPASAVEFLAIHWNLLRPDGILLCGAGRC